MTFMKVAAIASLCIAGTVGAAVDAWAFNNRSTARLLDLSPSQSTQQASTNRSRNVLDRRLSTRRTAARHGVLPMTRGGAQARQMDRKFLPATVAYSGRYAPGTIVIDTNEKFLYHVQPGGTARRYGVGVGRPGFQWAGTHRVSQKREWPGWTPPPAMRRRQPELPAYMPGGPENPLGARAMYLGSTLYRIHGSNAPWSIGHEVSSGCIRMRNEDVIALYENVNVGTKVVVLR
ncbi:MAG: L,D-transpeptidase [Pseudomonadota bacterium]